MHMCGCRYTHACGGRSTILDVIPQERSLPLSTVFTLVVVVVVVVVVIVVVLLRISLMYFNYIIYLTASPPDYLSLSTQCQALSLS